MCIYHTSTPLSMTKLQTSVIPSGVEGESKLQTKLNQNTIR